MKPLIITPLALISASLMAHAEPDWVHNPAGPGPGAGKHSVLIAGDEEYRSGDGLPMLGKILSRRHGFTCNVLLSVGKSGFIDPDAGTSLSHPEALDSADAILLLIRFRKWPDETMKRFDAAMGRGVPVIGLRTSTDAFQLPKTSGFAGYNTLGKDVLGEQWVSHWGNHKDIKPSAHKL